MTIKIDDMVITPELAAQALELMDGASFRRVEHPPPPKLEDVAPMLERFSKCLGTCEKCEAVSFAKFYEDVIARAGENASNEEAIASATNSMRLDGWEPFTDRAGYVRRCSDCANSPLYPWASSLDPQRVHAWMMERHSAGNYDPFCADDLRVLL